MKIRSKALYAYLLEAGVLNGTLEEIDRAKSEYRRIYKQQWKQRKRPRKEIRMEVTLKDFEVIKIQAAALSLTPTSYARTAVLSSIGSAQLMPNKKALLKVLQLLSTAAIASAKHTLSSWQLSELLAKAEDMLLQYLNVKRD